MDYQSFLNQRLQELKDSGAYRYFLEVNKSAQHFPVFIMLMKKDSNMRQLTGAVMIT
jgi:hypothetical protein